MSTSRETLRDALAALLEAGLVGTGLPVKTVAGSKQTTLTGNSPLVCVLPRGSTRTPMTFQGNRLAADLLVTVFVLQSETDWTYAQAINALDDIEARIAQIYEDNRNGDDWEVLEYAAATKIVEVAIEGIPYYMETIPTRVSLARN